jgi:vacuolar protein sorting-associated protein 54
MSDTASSSSRPTSPAPTVAATAAGAPVSARPYRFHWDPAAARRAGPGSVISESTGVGADWVGGGAGALYAQNTSTASLPLGALPAEWSSARNGFHGVYHALSLAPMWADARPAISTVLNHPHKRHAPPKAHSHLPTVAAATLPRVRRKDFEPYLSAVAPEWERFERNAALGRSGAPALSDSAASDSQLAPPGTPTPMTPMSPSTPRPAAPARPLPPLETVPTVFFERAFDLGDQRTFNAVTEQPTLGERVDTGAGAAVLELLSAHADTVEQHLVREIGERSPAFFAALANLHALRAESGAALARISQLRARLTAVGERGARPGLAAVRAAVRAQNVARTQAGVRAVAGIVEMTGVARGLVNAGQFTEALGVVERMQTMWDHGAPAGPAITPGSALSEHSTEQDASPPAPTIPLSSLKAFAALPTHLRDLTTEIASALSGEFVSALQQDLSARLEVDLAAPEAQAELGARLRERLRPILDGLVRTRTVKDALSAWREGVLAEVRGAIRKVRGLY